MVNKTLYLLRNISIVSCIQHFIFLTKKYVVKIIEVIRADVDVTVLFVRYWRRKWGKNVPVQQLFIDCRKEYDFISTFD
jgi:hypothetical protein